MHLGGQTSLGPNQPDGVTCLHPLPRKTAFHNGRRHRRSESGATRQGDPGLEVGPTPGGCGFLAPGRLKAGCVLLDPVTPMAPHIWGLQWVHYRRWEEVIKDLKGQRETQSCVLAPLKLLGSLLSRVCTQSGSSGSCLMLQAGSALSTDADAESLTSEAELTPHSAARGEGSEALPSPYSSVGLNPALLLTLCSRVGSAVHR